MGERFAEVVASPPYGYPTVCPALTGGFAKLASADELERLLRRVAEEVPRPVLATVRRADGDQLSIGLGRSLSYLTYVPADEDPPYFDVAGVGEDHEEVWFDYLGEPTPYGANSCVPFELALTATRRFVESSGLPLPDVVDWVEL